MDVIGNVVGNQVRVHAQDVAKELTLRVRITGARQLAFRVQIGRWLIMLAARIVGCNLRLTED